jgi:diacylglycerol kinase family enzyme
MDFFSFSWVLNTIDKMQLEFPPAIALFPIGTGNDLARDRFYETPIWAENFSDKFSSQKFRTNFNPTKKQICIR